MITLSTLVLTADSRILKRVQWMAVYRAVSTAPQFGSGNQACSASRVGIVSQVRKVGDNRVVTAFLSFSYHLADATLQYLQFKCCVCCQCTADCIYGISLLSFGTFLAWKVKHRSLSIIYLIKSLYRIVSEFKYISYRMTVFSLKL